MLAADLFRRYRDLVGGQIDPPVKAVIDAHLATQKQLVSGKSVSPRPMGVCCGSTDNSWVDARSQAQALLSPGQHQFALGQKEVGMSAIGSRSQKAELRR